MKGLQYYRNLPETISAETIIEELNYFFSSIQNQLSVEDSIGILYELADRQWRTYQILSDKCLLQVLESFLFKCIDFNCENLLDNIIHISIALGLKTVFDFIINSKHHIVDIDILNMVIDYEREVIDISDPYIGLR